MQPTIELIRTAVAAMERAVVQLGSHVEPPQLVEISGLPFHRHRQYSDLLFSYLKCVQAISALNACLVLYNAGFIFEVNTLCRIIDECAQDVIFQAADETGDGTPTTAQLQMLKEFFKEEFADPLDPVGSSQARAPVPRQKVHAQIARTGSPDNPSDLQALQQTIHRALSGFVHGTYVHIMELFGAPKRGFHLRGMLGTPRMDETLDSLASAAYRAMNALWVLAKRYGADAVAAELAEARRLFYAVAKLGG